MKITFIIGGARSGKSSFALREASGMIGHKLYLATAEALDDEMKERIANHKSERGNDWDTIEEPVNIASIISESLNKFNVVLLDCLTLWLSSVMIRTQSAEHRIQNTDKREQNSKYRSQMSDPATGKAEKSISEFIDALQQLKEAGVLCSGFCNLYIVSNEVGMGIVPDNKLARQFRDLAGKVNQKVAELADEVYLVTAGIPIKIK